MIVQINSENDLGQLEECVRSALGAQRLDVSIMRSKPYIDLRRALLLGLGGGAPSLSGGTYFHMEDVVLRVLQWAPLLVWVGHRDAEIFEDDL
jgi:hypothetical protein